MGWPFLYASKIAIAKIRSAAAVCPVVELVLIHFAAERVAMDAQDFRGARLISVEPLEHAPDEFLLKLGDGFFEQDSALDHRSDQRFELIFHDRTLRTIALGENLNARRRWKR